MTRLCAALVLASVALAPAVPAARSTPAPRQSLSIAFLYDVTISMTGLKIESDDQFKKATEAITRALQPGDVFRFGVVANRLLLTETMTSVEAAKALQGVPQVPAKDRAGPTPLWDVLVEAVTAVRREVLHPVVLIVTDGRSTGNLHSLDDVVAQAKRAGVPISAIVEDSLMRRAGTVLPIRPFDTMSSLATATGGLAEFDDGHNPGGDIGALVTKIVAALRER
jgi:hypothetical protein